jgi:hypothetical protein
MMNIQEQEHWEFEAGRASEFQNCYQEAEVAALRAGNDAARRIQAVLDAGRFAVVAYHPYHCKATDAVAGEVPCLCGQANSRKQAEAILNALAESDPDARWIVLPREPQQVSQPVDSEDVPF